MDLSDEWAKSASSTRSGSLLSFRLGLPSHIALPGSDCLAGALDHGILGA